MGYLKEKFVDDEDREANCVQELIDAGGGYAPSVPSGSFRATAPPAIPIRRGR